MKRVSLFSIFFLSSVSIILAQKTVQGVVSDKTSDGPLPGVAVGVKSNASKGVITDFNGNFSISLEANESVLIFNYLGYKTQEVAVTAGANNLKIQLEEDALQLEGVLVTANKTVQRVQDVPLSITAIGAKQLERTGATTAEDYFPSIPNLSITASGGGGASFGDGRSSGKNISIRGISGTNTTAFYLDETPLPEFADPRIFDVERVEVLRGPQGTLYGSNTMGGAVKVVTKQPNAYNLSGSIDVMTAAVTEGDADYSLEGVFNLPLKEEKLALRLGVFYGFQTGVYDRKQQTEFNGFPLNTGEGSGVNPGAVYSDPNTGATIPYDLGILPITIQDNANSSLGGNFKENVDDETSFGINAALGFYPNENVKIIPKVMYQKTKGDGYDFADFDEDNFTQYRIVGIDEAYELDLFHSSLLTEFKLESGIITNNFSYTGLNQSDTEDASERGGSGPTNTEITPFDENGDFADLSTAYFYPDLVTRTGELGKIVEELRYSSTNEGKFNYTIGGFYSSETSKFDATQTRATYLDDLAGFFNTLIGVGVTEVEGLPEFIASQNGVWYAQDTDFKTNEFALFGELYWDITPKLTFTTGLRYFTYTQDLNQIISGFVASGGGEPTNESTSDSDFTPKFNLTYRVSDDNIVYGNVSRGYRLGGANGIVPLIFAEDELAALGLDAAPTSFAPDYLWTYEAGSKNTFFDNKLTANLSVFHTIWNDLQQRVFLPVSGFLFVDNIGKAKMTGFELELNSKVAKNLQVSGSVGYTKAEIDEGSILTGAEKGDRVLNVPELTASASMQYSHDVGEKGSLFYRVDLQHTGDRVNTFTPETQPAFVFDAFTILNARIGYTTDHYDISLFAKNLTNEIANFGDITSLSATPFNRTRYATGRPSSFGINLKYTF